MNAPRHKWIEGWDDERSSGNSLIVTLIPGRKWDDDECHTRGFDTVKEALNAVRHETEPCHCEDCTAIAISAAVMDKVQPLLAALKAVRAQIDAALFEDAQELDADGLFALAQIVDVAISKAKGRA